MSAVCSICKREDRPAIEQSHIDGLSLRAIAKLHPGTTAWSLRRHFAHVPVIIENQQKLERQQVQNDRATCKLPARVESLIAELEGVTANALRRRDYASALRSITARLQCLKTIGELRPGAGEFVAVTGVTAAAAASVTVNLPAAAPKDAAHFVQLLRQVYGLPPGRRARGEDEPKTLIM
jgi:hypothetical protein